MIAGVSTACLYPHELEISFRQLAENGVKTVEIFVNTDCELKNPYLSEMLNIQKEYSVEVVSVHPFTCGIEPMMLFTHYERRVNDMIEYYKRFLEYMNLFGAKYFILHGNKNENKFPDELYFERFVQLQDTAESFGVSVLQENVSRCTAGNTEFIRKMIDNIGDKAKFVLDTKQAHRSGADPINFICEFGKYVKHIHFSDFGKNGDCLKFGFGEYNNLQFFSELLSFNYTGRIILELYINNHDGLNDLIHNYNYLNEYLKNNGFFDFKTV